MTQNTKYLIKIFRKRGENTISTLSPNGRYFFRIKRPIDLYWGLMCCPISFFDIEGNLIYYNKEQYVEIGEIGENDDNPWFILNWSLSGNLAFFIERNSTKSCQYVLLNLKDQTISITEYQGHEEEKWFALLSKILTEDKARDVYYNIICQETPEKVMEYVDSIDFIENKKELKDLLEEYYFGEFNMLIEKLIKGGFDDEIVSNSILHKFVPIKSNKLNKSLLELIGINKWRP